MSGLVTVEEYTCAACTGRLAIPFLSPFVQAGACSYITHPVCWGAECGGGVAIMGSEDGT